MMSRKHWFMLFCLFVLYLLLGAWIFLYIESQEEIKKSIADQADKQIIEELMKRHYQGDDSNLQHIFNRLTDYCDKPIHYNMGSEKPSYKWDFYNSLFFVITVVSTIGYGNLAPTTMFTRIFTIFYALIGIPMNGIVMVTMGEYFGKSFTKLYGRWKRSRVDKSSAKLGLIGQIILYAVPGLTFFIFLPSTLISVFEGWDYDLALYYAFETLLTIGFGDYVAGGANIPNFSPEVLICYKIFILVWIIGGLGYLVMVIGFITKGMRSRKIAKIERVLTENLKKTPQKIRQELRSLLQEFLFTRVKPVYKGDFEYTPQRLERSQSCPHLTLWRNLNSPSMARRRAMSECHKYMAIQKVQSESELDKIDKEQTFKPSDALMRQKDLILKVVEALSGAPPSPQTNVQEGVQGFTDSQILATEQYDNLARARLRRRAVSEIKPPPKKFSTAQSGNTWYGSTATAAFEELQRQMVLNPHMMESAAKPTFLKRMKNRLNLFKEDKATDVEKQNIDDFDEARRPSFLVPDGDDFATRRQSILSLRESEQVLEQTSIADFIRALSAITVPEPSFPRTPKRKMGTASLTPPNEYSSTRSPFNFRRPSFIPPTNALNLNVGRRRCSLMPVEENLLSSPPPYAAIAPGQRRFSVRPTNTALLNINSVGSVRTQLNKKKKTSDSDK